MRCQACNRSTEEAFAICPSCGKAADFWSQAPEEPHP